MFQERSWLVGLRRLGASASSADFVDDETPGAGVGERFADDDVNLQDGLAVEAAVAVSSAVGEQLRVERLEVLGAESTQRDGPDAGDDVQLITRR